MRWPLSASRRASTHSERPAASEHEAAGFTLIELLAVVAIVLILLSLLLPVLTGLRERAHTAVCQSNLRQIMAAADLYASEHDGSYPDCWRWVWSDSAPGGDWHSTWVDWAQADTVTRGDLYTNHYIDDVRVFLCPTFKRDFRLNPAFGHLTPHVGYAMNEYLMTWAAYQTWNGRQKIIRTQVSLPSTFGVFADEGTVALPWGPVWINNLCLGVGDLAVAGSYCDAIGAFHNAPNGDPTRGKGNVAFADGHVALVDSRDSKFIMTPPLYR